MIDLIDASPCKALARNRKLEGLGSNPNASKSEKALLLSQECGVKCVMQNV